MRPCTRCGKCCLKYSSGSGLGSVTKRDFLRWVIERPELLVYIGAPIIADLNELLTFDLADVDLGNFDLDNNRYGDLWISPDTGKRMELCPWLQPLPPEKKYLCRIYTVRPEFCRNYPENIDRMISDGCEMLEEKDLEKPHGQLVLELKKLRNQ